MQNWRNFLLGPSTEKKVCAVLEKVFGLKQEALDNRSVGPGFKYCSLFGFLHLTLYNHYRNYTIPFSLLDLRYKLTQQGSSPYTGQKMYFQHFYLCYLCFVILIFCNSLSKFVLFRKICLILTSDLKLFANEHQYPPHYIDDKHLLLLITIGIVHSF